MRFGVGGALGLLGLMAGIAFLTRLLSVVIRSLSLLYRFEQGMGLSLSPTVQFSQADARAVCHSSRCCPRSYAQ